MGAAALSVVQHAAFQCQDGMIHSHVRVIKQMMHNADDDAQTKCHASIVSAKKKQYITYQFVLLSNRLHCQSHAAECCAVYIVLHAKNKQRWYQLYNSTATQSFAVPRL